MNRKYSCPELLTIVVSSSRVARSVLTKPGLHPEPVLSVFAFCRGLGERKGVPAGGQIRVSWQPASHSSAVPVEGYYFSWYTGTGTGAQPSALTPRGQTTYTITGLTNGSAYSVFVYAVNAAGKSAHIWGKATPRAATPTAATHPRRLR